MNNNHATIAVIAIAAAGVIGAAVHFGHPYVFPSLEQQCIRAWHDQMLDPNSVSAVESYTYAEGGKELIHVQVRGKNAFGAYALSAIECPITNGKIDQLHTDVHRLTR